MKVSYLITCSNETTTLHNLMTLFPDIVTEKNEDEIVYLVDEDAKNNEETLKLVESACCFENRWDLGDVSRIRSYKHSLSSNYGAHKNFGIQHCNGDFIFQIDGDELPPESLLGENLHGLLASNPTVEAYAVARINDFKGVTPAHAQQWGWRLTESPKYKRPIVNFPDYQFRIFKRDFPRISFTRRLHEKIEGYSSYVTLPATEEYALYHDKTIEKQIATNLKYNQAFTEAENQGHGVFK